MRAKGRNIIILHICSYHYVLYRNSEIIVNCISYVIRIDTDISHNSVEHAADAHFRHV